MSASLESLRQRAVPSAPSIGQATAVEQARAVAEVAAAVQVARQFPRDMERVRRAMQAACGSLALANRAFYSVPNRGTGPSVHLAREMAREFGNFQYGVHELRRDDAAGISEVQAFAWDVETNTRSTRTFIAPHAKMKGKERQALTDLNDIYLSNQNVGARAVRECIFAALPQWLVEEAETACRATLERGDGRSVAERADEAAKAFEGLGVQESQLVAKLRRPKAQWTPQNIADLLVIFTSIRRGESSVEEQFEPVRIQVADVVPPARQEAAPAPAAPAEAPPAASTQTAPTPAQTGDPLAERKAIQRLQILLRGALENDREKRLEWVEAQINRPIESTNELTALEADRCIKAAEQLPTRSRPSAPEEPPAEEDR